MAMNPRIKAQSIADEADDMTLLDLWHLIRRSWYLLVVGVAMGLALATVYLSITPKIYEATLQLELGKIRREGGVDWIESHPEVSERVQRADFQTAVLNTLGWRGSMLGDLLRSSIRAYRKDSNVEIKVRSYSVEDARKAGQAIGEGLIAAHKALARRFESGEAEDLARFKARQKKLEAQLAQLDEIGAKIPPDDYVGRILWMGMSADKSAQLDKVRRSAAHKNDADSIILNYSAIDGTVSVPDSPVYPKSRNIWILALVGGALFGFFLIGLRPFLEKSTRQQDLVSVR